MPMSILETFILLEKCDLRHEMGSVLEVFQGGDEAKNWFDSYTDGLVRIQSKISLIDHLSVLLYSPSASAHHECIIVHG